MTTQAFLWLGLAVVGICGVFYFGNPLKRRTATSEGLFYGAAVVTAGGLLGVVRELWRIQ